MTAPSRDNWNELTRAASICMRAVAIRLVGSNANVDGDYTGAGYAASKSIAEEAEQPCPAPAPPPKPKVL